MSGDGVDPVVTDNPADDLREQWRYLIPVLLGER